MSVYFVDGAPLTFPLFGTIKDSVLFYIPLFPSALCLGCLSLNTDVLSFHTWACCQMFSLCSHFRVCVCVCSSSSHWWASLCVCLWVSAGVVFFFNVCCSMVLNFLFPIMLLEGNPMFKTGLYNPCFFSVCVCFVYHFSNCDLIYHRLLYGSRIYCRQKNNW